jgi:spore coat polysaccharide biosynthesis predicted glycosyltransferase SpsG/RimJ/RimL family protein N-acetyltransferase
MNVLFRLDAGKKYGLGHLTRNIYLHDELISRNFNTLFIIKTDDTGFIKEFLTEKNINIDAHFLNNKTSQEIDINTITKISNLKNIKIAIIDHYNYNIKYLESIKKNNLILVNYDINIKKNFVSDVILNPNIGFNLQDYKGTCRYDTRLCIGKKYLIINPKLKKKKSTKRVKENILISFGGGTYPEKIFNLIDRVTDNKELKFIIISSDKKIINITKSNTKVYFGDLDYNKIYSSLRFAIVSGGVTSQELAFLNIPMLIYPYADNHKKTITGLIKANLALKAKMENLLNLDKFETYKLVPKIKIDNKGIERITKEISEAFISKYSISGERINLRPLKITDTPTIIRWRNDVEIKKWMINQDSISKESHIDWFNSRKNRFDFIIEENKSKKPIGTLNLKLTSKFEAELGKLIGENFFLGKGYANESSNLLINFAFNNLYLKKLFVYTKTTNQKNINLNKKLGFKIEQKMKINSNQVYKMCLKNNV